MESCSYWGEEKAEEGREQRQMQEVNYTDHESFLSVMDPWGREGHQLPDREGLARGGGMWQ